jgi:hypothetical protein
MIKRNTLYSPLCPSLDVREWLISLGNCCIEWKAFWQLCCRQDRFYPAIKSCVPPKELKLPTSAPSWRHLIYRRRSSGDPALVALHSWTTDCKQTDFKTTSLVRIRGWYRLRDLHTTIAWWYCKAVMNGEWRESRPTFQILSCYFQKRTEGNQWGWYSIQRLRNMHQTRCSCSRFICSETVTSYR